jgi:hypothetical protein
VVSGGSERVARARPGETAQGSALRSGRTHGCEVGTRSEVGTHASEAQGTTGQHGAAQVNTGKRRKPQGSVRAGQGGTCARNVAPGVSENFSPSS